MSTSYSANQYESAFKSQKLQNWTIPKHFKERPSAVEGYTTFIATDRGHLLPAVKTKRGSAWPSFQGTWDLQHHFAPVYINPTARSQQGLDRLSTWGKTKSATSQGRKASGDSRATSRASQKIENIKVNQPAEASQMPDTNPNQCEPEPHEEQPSSQQNQALSRPTSQSELVNQTRSGLVTQQSQVKPTKPVQENSIAADTTPE